MRRRLGVALAVLALGASGCGAGYLVRAGLNEARILWRREPIVDVLARPGLDPVLRARLALVLAVRGFAAETLGLRVGESFTTFAEADGEAIVHVLSAAHRDRLEPYTWWYPIVGRVPYRGFFTRTEADAAARALEASGLDVDVRPATAFSTLGWFADPLLSTTAKAGPVALAETVIHELFHATLYLPGEATFNESAATFVGHRGAIAFFCDRGRDDATGCARARERWDRTRAHGRVLARYAGRLRTLYAQRRSARWREARRAALAAAAGRALARRGLGDPHELSPPNNARLLAMLVYETDLDGFDRLARSDAALAAAIAAVVEAASDAADPFAAVRGLDAGALQIDAVRLDSLGRWSPSPLPSTPCSAGSPAGSAFSVTTSPTGRTCTARRSSARPGAKAG